MDQGMKTFPPRSAQIPSTWVGALAWNVLLCRLADASPCTPKAPVVVPADRFATTSVCRSVKVDPLSAKVRRR